MTGWIEKHPEPTIGRWLVIVPRRAELENARFGSVDVADGEVEVDLLGVRTAGPGRRDPVVDALKGEGSLTVWSVW